MSKYLFFDLDGTLEGHTRTITQKNRWALQQLRHNGHKIFLCTGRAPTSLFGDVLSICFDGKICSAGGFVMIGEHFIFENYIDKNLLQQILHLFNQHHVYYNLETKDTIYESPIIHKFLLRKYLKIVKLNRKLLGFMRSRRQFEHRRHIKEFDIHQTQVTKLNYLAKNKEDFIKCLPFLEKYFHIVYFSNENDKFVNGELILKNCTKGDGIQRILDYFHADEEDTIGFGDSMNDYQMIQKVHIGIVSENAPDELKKISQYTFVDPDQDGIYHTLKALGLCEKYQEEE